VEWNFVSSFCTCVMEENIYSYCTISTDETTLKPNDSGSHHDHVHHLVTTLARKYSRCSFSRKIKNSAREGHSNHPEHLT